MSASAPQLGLRNHYRSITENAFLHVEGLDADQLTSVDDLRRDHSAPSDLRRDDRIQTALLNDVARPTPLSNGVATGGFQGYNCPVLASSKVDSLSTQLAQLDYINGA